MSLKLQIACSIFCVGLFALWLHRACQADIPRASSDEAARTEQQKIHQELVRARCTAIGDTPDCQRAQQESFRLLQQQLEEVLKKYEKEYCGGKCPEVIPIPPEHPQQHTLKKASSL
jgi:hypothetical protein